MGYLLGSLWNSRTSSEFRDDFKNKDIILHKYYHYILINNISLSEGANESKTRILSDNLFHNFFVLLTSLDISDVDTVWP